VGQMVDLEQSTVRSVTHWSTVRYILSYSVHALCQSVHIYLLRI